MANVLQRTMMLPMTAYDDDTDGGSGSAVSDGDALVVVMMMIPMRANKCERHMRWIWPQEKCQHEARSNDCAS